MPRPLSLLLLACLVLAATSNSTHSSPYSLESSESSESSKSSESSETSENFENSETSEFAKNSNYGGKNFEFSRRPECLACGHREALKRASLESIKQHVLLKLGFHQATPTSSDALPPVPAHLLQKFWHLQKNPNGGKISKNPNGGKNSKNLNGGKNGKKAENLENFDNSENSEGSESNGQNSKNEQFQYGGESFQNGEMIRNLYGFQESKEGGKLAPPPIDDSMMGDQPRGEGGREVVEEEDDDYFPTPTTIYAFTHRPSPAKLRHQKRELLQFRLSPPTHARAMEATLHVFVRGLDDADASAALQLLNGQQPMIDLTVQATQADGQGKMYQRQMSRLHNVSITSTGRYVELNVTQMVSEWLQQPQTLHSCVVRVHLVGNSTLLKPLQKLLALELNQGPPNETIPYLEIELEDSRRRRMKRSMILYCNETTTEQRCCRYPLTVDFEKFGWDWIIAPKRYEANYCAGECQLSFLPKYPHTHVWQLSTSASPCCSPRKMAAIKLLYFDLNFNIVYSTIPNMVVETCTCS